MSHLHYINILLAIITHHPVLAYGAVFLISLSESLTLVGLIIPGTVIMFGVGAVVATGSLDLKTVLTLAALGAIAGDGISYWLGHHYKDQLRQVWPFSRYPGMLEKGEVFFKRHGGISVLFGRFVGPVRPVIPVVAGMLGMRPLHFSVVNVVSAIGWALVYILPGVFFGTSLAVAGAVSTRLAVLVFILLVAVWGFIWLGRKLVLRVGHQGPVWFATFKGWISTDEPVHWLLRPVKSLFSYLFLRQQGEELFLIFLVLLLSLSGWGALSVLQDVLAKDPLVLADQAVYHFFQSLRTPWADPVFAAISELGDSFVNICLFFAILVVLVSRKCYRTAGFWTITILGALAGFQSLKGLSHLVFPVVVQGVLAFGSLSGHTATSVILYGFLAILLARSSLGSLRWGIFITVLLISFIIALSHLYLGTHWLSDILGGIFIGTSWTALSGIAWLKKPTPKVPRCLLGLVTILIIVFAGGWHVARNLEKDLVLYAPRYNVQTMAFAVWSGSGWKNLSAWRFDMGGEREQPLTIQWAGSPEKLVRHLLSLGWHRPSPMNLKSLLGIFSPDVPIEKLPVLPHLHSGRVDRLRLIYRDKNNRWVLRLWPSDTIIEKGNTPLFIGTIEVQHLRHLTGLIIAAMDTGEYDHPLDGIKGMLKDQFSIESVSRSGEEIQVDDDHRRIHWQGRVLLIWERCGQ
ncbi:MAG: VTT domain-containing protein [Desulfobacula sp.]|jgi:membrane protein DedA with SNARE-associated domain|nr:VTT domain-containing protein [Desulfobacula sp.]